MSSVFSSHRKVIVLAVVAFQLPGVLVHVFMSLCSAAVSASSASLFMYLISSLLADVFTTLSFSLYSFEIISLSLRDLVSNSFFLIRLLSSL
ncbi:hypothetical protein DPMN_017943 [Dreissena polymorpha]|uniref:Uncharacterized protein n=1 Tax=Dreissena polymorpha TaxID=45954 RepID=A0A9D4S8P0_DREPO|nr:hypothetical protein DPMN_017943 [Dreissena polymorpha]